MFCVTVTPLFLFLSSMMMTTTLMMMLLLLFVFHGVREQQSADLRE